jgi:hypothetical protein
MNDRINWVSGAAEMKLVGYMQRIRITNRLYFWKEIFN